MPDFNNSQQAKKFQEIRNQEEEIFVERIAGKFDLPFYCVLLVKVHQDRFRLCEYG